MDQDNSLPNYLLNSMLFHFPDILAQTFSKKVKYCSL